MWFKNYIVSLLKNGKCTFTSIQVQKDLNKSRKAVLSSLEHAMLSGEIVSPAKGFYVIVDPKYRDLGCIPAEFFVPYLMEYWKCKYYAGLFEGAPVCNNLSERMLKSIIRHRKNSLFFKTQIGAAVADILTTILYTAKANNINSVDYLRNLLLHQHHWKQNPKEWLPWN